MKTIQAFEFKDLKKEVQEKVFERFLSQEIDFQLTNLWHEESQGLITEEDVYKIIGCSKYYAESTAWFVPSVYYEHHEKELKSEVKRQLKDCLFNEMGTSI